MSKHIVYGNGESRPRKPIVGGDFITWGCNAIYRDFVLDNLVSVDYNMQQEIYESGYAIRNKCDCMCVCNVVCLCNKTVLYVFV